MKNTYVALVTLTVMATGCQVGEVTDVAEQAEPVPIVLAGFDDGSEGERLVGELVGDELRLSPDFTAALAAPEIAETAEDGSTTTARGSYDLRLTAGGVNVALDPASPVVPLAPRLGPDEPIRLIVSDGEAPVATLDLRLGDPAEAAEHGDDLIYYHTCPSGSGTWSLMDSRFAISACGTCGAGKRSWIHRVMVCHSCPNGSTGCGVVEYSEYCDYC